MSQNLPSVYFSQTSSLATTWSKCTRLCIMSSFISMGGNTWTTLISSLPVLVLLCWTELLPYLGRSDVTMQWWHSVPTPKYYLWASLNVKTCPSAFSKLLRAEWGDVNPPTSRFSQIFHFNPVKCVSALPSKCSLLNQVSEMSAWALGFARAFTRTDRVLKFIHLGLLFCLVSPAAGSSQALPSSHVV